MCVCVYACAPSVCVLVFSDGVVTDIIMAL